MDVQGRKCKNCRHFDRFASKDWCCIDRPWVEIPETVNSVACGPKKYWCSRGSFARWDRVNKRWQFVPILDDFLDMKKRAKNPIGRDADTTIITPAEGFKVAFDGQQIPTDDPDTE